MATKVLPCIRLPGLQTELVPALVPLAKLHPVHFPSVLNCNDEDNELGVVNLIDNTIVPDTNTVEGVGAGQFFVS